MPLLHKIVAGIVLGALYAGWMTYNGHLVPGVVGGILAAIVVVMVLNRMEERRRQRR
jgi:ABC-type Mn2+/Zn2+ transport system permease subunit